MMSSKYFKIYISLENPPDYDDATSNADRVETASTVTELLDGDYQRFE